MDSCDPNLIMLFIIFISVLRKLWRKKKTKKHCLFFFLSREYGLDLS